MSLRLVSHNQDLQRLADTGYAIAFASGHLIVRDVPYLDAGGELKIGAIVTIMQFIDADRVQQVDHQVFFAGGIPHQLDGTPIRNLGGGETTVYLGENATDVVVQRSFSNKPKETGRFADFFEKIESYVAIVSGPAIAKFNVSPLTFRNQLDAVATKSVFKFEDTLSSRARIGELSSRLTEDVIAIIGLGGTGSFVLDQMVRTPVAEIRGFDFDFFHVHSAFRSPGRLDPQELGMKKVDVYRRRYESFRGSLSMIDMAVDASSGPELEGVTFAFVCVDKGPARAQIFDLLVRLGIPFIDAGMGLNKKRGAISGLVRLTYFAPDEAAKTVATGYAPLMDADDELYRSNIQIAELNALAASLSVVRYKQHRGFYSSEISQPCALLEIADLSIAFG